MFLNRNISLVPLLKVLILVCGGSDGGGGRGGGVCVYVVCVSTVVWIPVCSHMHMHRLEKDLVVLSWETGQQISRQHLETWRTLPYRQQWTQGKLVPGSL